MYTSNNSTHGGMMIYCFDIDGTICTSVENSQYELAEPFEDMVKAIRDLYNSGHTIKIITARGSVSGKDWGEFTAIQLEKWGIKYHELIMYKKPHADIFVDDKAMNVSSFRLLLGD